MNAQPWALCHTHTGLASEKLNLLTSVHTKWLEAQLALGPSGQVTDSQAGRGGWSAGGQTFPLDMELCTALPGEGLGSPRALEPDALESLVSSMGGVWTDVWVLRASGGGRGLESQIGEGPG